MALAEVGIRHRLGLDPWLFSVAESAAYSQIMDVKGDKMLNGDFTPEGRVRQTLKDVQLMLEQAKRRGQALPMLNVHCDVLEACVRAGESDLDNSAVIKEIARRQRPTP
jgi:3-hydroxyisobutyrate dehydrogenase-like beta-hydroxyacid dehydrogenase